MQATYPCLIIYTIIAGKKCYIEHTCQKYDGTHIAILNTDKQQAMPFITGAEVEKFISKLSKENNRKYFTEESNCTKLDISPPNTYSQSAKNAMVYQY